MKRLLALFAVLVVGRVDAEDFLYVLATPVGGASEIHWVPANAPLGARVLVEDLPRSNLLYLHRDSLWWREGGDLVERDLIGQKPGVNGRVDTRGFVRAVVRHGDQLYWSEGGRFWRKGLQDDQRKVSINNVGGIPRVVIHEDRLYFVRSLKPVSVRLDGTDYRVEDGGVSFPSIRRLDPIVMAVQGDRLILGQEKLVWQIDLKTREVMVLDTGLPEIVESIATSNGGVVGCSEN